MVTRDMVRHAKPDPDLFLAAAALLGVDPRDAMVVGDSVWDLLAARRAGSLGIGLMSGGYGREELERAGAYRVYADPADLLARADEVGIRKLLPGRPILAGGRRPALRPAACGLIGQAVHEEHAAEGRAVEALVIGVDVLVQHGEDSAVELGEFGRATGAA